MEDILRDLTAWRPTSLFFWGNAHSAKFRRNLHCRTPHRTYLIRSERTVGSELGTHQAGPESSVGIPLSSWEDGLSVPAWGGLGALSWLHGRCWSRKGPFEFGEVRGGLTEGLSTRVGLCS